MEFRKRFRRKRPALFKSGQWHFPKDNAPVHNSILVTDYLSKMGIKTVPQSPYSPDLAPCDFCLFPKLRGCRYKRIEDFHGAFQKVLERYTKCIAAGGDYFEGDSSFMCVLSIKVPIWKKAENLFNDHRTSFIKFKEVACSDSVSHNRVQVLGIHVLLLAYSQDWTCNLQMLVSLEAY